jgi:hypothetical protein
VKRKNLTNPTNLLIPKLGLLNPKKLSPKNLPGLPDSKNLSGPKPKRRNLSSPKPNRRSLSGPKPKPGNLPISENRKPEREERIVNRRFRRRFGDLQFVYSAAPDSWPWR